MEENTHTISEWEQKRPVVVYYEHIWCDMHRQVIMVKGLITVEIREVVNGQAIYGIRLLKAKWNKYGECFVGKNRRRCNDISF